MDFILEVIAFTIESALIADRSGAHRIELCDNPGDGGTTASHAMIELARKKTIIQLFPIIRPRGGDFLYSDEEFVIMQKDILWCKQNGCDGVVIGMLKEDGTVDRKRTAKLVELAYPMSVTFHRAFDRVLDPFQSLEDIIEIGCERILTSGKKPTAIEGSFLLKQLVEQSDERIIIMPGSGVRANNILEIAKQTGAREFHSSARTDQPSRMEYQNPELKEELKAPVLNEEEVRQILAHLDEFKPLS
jgi:copper homeostasis protein